MDSPIARGFVAGLPAGLATGIGALGVYSVHGLSRRANDVPLSTAAGIMLVATPPASARPAPSPARRRNL